LQRARSRRCSRYIKGVGAKKQRREPSGRLQRQNSPSGEGCASTFRPISSAKATAYFGLLGAGTIK
jgi:hypothetical protein